MRIRDLLELSELRLTLLCGEEHLDRLVTGAQVTDLPDPGRYLSGGELVLTGLMWLQGPEDCERFAGTLAAAGVAVLAAGDARLGHIPGDLVQACAKHGLPLLEVPVEVSFGTVVEAVSRGVAGVRAGELRSALGRYRRIVAAVAEGAGLEELLALMAAELGVTGAVISATGTVIAGTLDDALAGRLAGAYLAAQRLPQTVSTPEGAFTLFAVDRSHRMAGWVLACAGELDTEIGFELAACAAMERNRMEEGRRVERRLAEQLFGLAFAASPDPAELAARLRTCGIDAAEPYAVVTATVTRPGATEGPDPASLGGRVLEEMLDRRAVAAAGADGAVALVPLTGWSTGGDSADALVTRLRERTDLLTLGPAPASGPPRARVAVGVSAAMKGTSAIRGGVEEAGHARRLAEARGGGVVMSDEIYTYALLLATVPDDVRRSFALRLLGPLFDYDRGHQSELVRTLGTFLECAGSWNGCAERLHVHVNTVRYRIRRVEELTGRDLSSMADRVDLFLALRAG